MLNSLQTWALARQRKWRLEHKIWLEVEAVPHRVADLARHVACQLAAAPRVVPREHLHGRILNPCGTTQDGTLAVALVPG